MRVPMLRNPRLLGFSVSKIIINDSNVLNVAMEIGSGLFPPEKLYENKNPMVFFHFHRRHWLSVYDCLGDEPGADARFATWDNTDPKSPRAPSPIVRAVLIPLANTSTPFAAISNPTC